MFQRQLNQIRVDLELTPRAPLLIRSGRMGSDPSRPDLECVRTSFEGRPTVYVPGSSLKGVMRAHAERLLTSEGLKITPTFAKDAPQAFRQDVAGTLAYAGTCPLGRTFGNLHLKGRVSVSDLLPGGHERPRSAERERLIAAANATEQRNGVGIDRLLGSAKRGALFDQEVVVGGRFDGRVLLRNVQLYQLALVLLVVRDLDEGWAQLGSGTSRGNGWVEAKIRGLVIETRAGRTPAGRLAGVGGLGEKLEEYETCDGDAIDLPAGLVAQRELVWDRVTVTGEHVDALAAALVEGPWQAFLQWAEEKRWAA
jgi:CRISPR/Cas system CSM-associated protein Csm3 (group 7 of RAMP superfamily)